MILDLNILIIFKIILFGTTEKTETTAMITENLLPLLQEIVKFLRGCDGHGTCLVSAHISSSTASDRLHPSDHLTPPIQHTVISTVCQSQDSPRNQPVLHDSQKCPRVLCIGRPSDEYLSHRGNKTHPRQLNSSIQQGLIVTT
jgi:hypothetical protein